MILRLEEVEEKLNYRFSDKTLLSEALTHSSYANDYLGNSELSNERLEFLGDAILDFVVGYELFTRFPEKQEGFLSKLRSEIVCESSLAEVAVSMGLNEYLRLGRGEESKGGRTRHSIISDMIESLIAAVFVDGGYEKAFAVVHTLMDSTIERGCAGELPKDYKTELQEYCQKNGKNTPSYKIVGETGPDHEKIFTAAAFIGGKQVGIGDGKSKKEAEAASARDAMSHLK